jgi:Ca2+-binding EF-hand superfamily protein
MGLKGSKLRSSSKQEQKTSSSQFLEGAENDFLCGSSHMEELLSSNGDNSPTPEDAFVGISKKIDTNNDGVLERKEIDIFVHDTLIFFGTHMHSTMKGSPWRELAEIKLIDICGAMEGLSEDADIKSYSSLSPTLAEKIQLLIATNLMNLVDQDQNGTISFAEFEKFDWRNMMSQLKEQVKK